MAKRPKVFDNVHHVDVLVQVNPREGYSHGWVRFFTRSYYGGISHHDDLVFELEYQRNVITDSKRVYETSLPDTRFDIGQHAQIAFYAGHVETKIDVEHPEQAKIVHGRLQAIARAIAKLPTKSNCDLARTVDALVSLGLDVEIKYILHNASVTRSELPSDMPASKGYEAIKILLAKQTLAGLAT
mgnify:CR=1 FL=1